MRLQLISPPELVTVEDDGVRRSALLLAVRGERRYVSVSRGAGLNHLRWVPGSLLGPAGPPPAWTGASRAGRRT